MYIRRIAEQNLKRILDGSKIGIILGARQVGKTTLVEHVLARRNALFLNFDIEIDKRRFLAAAALSPTSGLESLGNPEVLVVDEAQRLPDAPRIVKGWHDAQLPGKILLLGSSSLNLLDQAAESLTGRNERLLLPPLVFEEALRSQSWYSDAYTPQILQEQFATPVRVFLMQSLAFGSYPEVVLTQDKVHLLRELSSDYLWKDILQTGLVKSPDLIKRLLTPIFDTMKLQFLVCAGVARLAEALGTTSDSMEPWVCGVHDGSSGTARTTGPRATPAA